MSLLPQNIEAERSLASAFIASPREIGARMAERGMTSDFFYCPKVRLIVTALQDAWAQQKPCDVASLTVAMRASGALEAIGGPIEISLIAGEAPLPSAFDLFAQEVIRTYQLRQIFAECSKIASEANSATGSPETLLARLGEALTQIAGASRKAQQQTFRALLFEKIERMETSQPDSDRLLTGLTKLDQQSPLRLGEMPLIAGERKAGKSILSLTITRNVILAGHGVLYFSLEDRTSKVIDRLFAAESEIPIARQNAKSLQPSDWNRANAAVKRLADKHLFLRDDVYDLSAILAVARQTHASRPNLRLVVVDYAQLIRVNLAKGASREQEVAAVSRALRLLSMELNVAILLLCQLNKEGDTRDSKALEMDCTAMWKVCVPEEEQDINSKRLIVIPFQRNGDSNIAFPVSFRGYLGRMDNLQDGE